MNLKNLFGIFLVLVLVSISVYFVVGGSMGGTVTAPTENQYIARNTTFTITFNTSWKNVTLVTLYNITGSNFEINNATGKIFNLNHTIMNLTLPVNTGASNATSVTFVITTLNFTQGNYTFAVLVVNHSNLSLPELGGINSSYINVSVIIDNMPPESLIMVGPRNSTSAGDLNTIVNEETVQFGFNVTDSMSGNRTWGNPINCTFSINGTVTYVNSSIIVANQTASGTGSPNITWFNVSASKFDSGFHTWNISCVDFNNNVNSSARWVDGVKRNGNFTLTDTVGPTTTTPTFSASSVTDGSSVTITCTGSDTISSDPREYVSVRAPIGGDWQGDIGASPYTFTGTGTVGTYTARCRSVDTTGNTGGYSSESTFTVTKSTGSTSTSSDSGSSGGTSGSSKETVVVSVYQGQTQDLGSLDTANGVINAYQSSTVTFTAISSAETTASSHSIKFDGVNYIKKEMTITISSDPVTLTMKVGETKNVDVDGDGIDDLEITLNSIDENGKVNVSIKNIATTGTQEGTPEGATPEEAQPEEGKGTSSWVWWVLIIVVVVVIIALLIPKKKRK